ncbi:MAG: DUF2304 domain-containing protein [Candidatus Omnitrophota bacterium]
METLTSRIVSIVLSVSFLFLIVEMTRRNKLKEKYAILWFTIGVIIFLLSLFKSLILLIAKLLGIKAPLIALILLGLFFILTFCLHFSFVISSLSEQNKSLLQKIAILEEEISKGK